MNVKLRKALKIRTHLDYVCILGPTQVIDKLKIDVAVELSPDAIAHGDGSSEHIRGNSDVTGASVIGAGEAQFSRNGRQLRPQSAVPVFNIAESKCIYEIVC